MDKTSKNSIYSDVHLKEDFKRVIIETLKTKQGASYEEIGVYLIFLDGLNRHYLFITLTAARFPKKPDNVSNP